MLGSLGVGAAPRWMTEGGNSYANIKERGGWVRNNTEQRLCICDSFLEKTEGSLFAEALCGDYEC